MNAGDVQVHDYMTDDGRSIKVMLVTYGDVDKDQTVGVSIQVDGVERLQTGTHFTCPAGVPLGEWLIHGVLNCLCIHMEQWNVRDLLSNLLTMANADDNHFMPIDDRHITELTDEQAAWWNEDLNHPLVDYLYEQVRPAALKALDEYPQQLRANKEEK